MKVCHKLLACSILLVSYSPSAHAQATQLRQADAETKAIAEARQTSEVLGMSSSLDELSAMQKQRSCGDSPGLAEMILRQKLAESELRATLDADGVLSEISTERASLTDLGAGLQARRDRTTGLLNAGSLIAGSGIGIVVNATQIGTSTAIAGDYLGVGSGIASTALALLSIRKLRGPKGDVGAIPNMLAPLFDRPAQQLTYYPPSVLRFLESVPPGDNPERGTRLEQMKASWVSAGRTGLSEPKKDRAKIDALTASAEPNEKLSISDIADRVAMLNDVAGRVALIKRDLATVLHSYKAGVDGCAP